MAKSQIPTETYSTPSEKRDRGGRAGTRTGGREADRSTPEREGKESCSDGKAGAEGRPDQGEGPCGNHRGKGPKFERQIPGVRNNV